jgi:high-affinity nickel-transport protein
MEPSLVPLSGLSLMFLLGLRHGFDPDHIAMIDTMAYRALEERPPLAPWIGTLFALGHGLTVTAIAVVLGSFASAFALPAPVRDILEWLPTVLLILVGTLNLRDLLRRQDYRPTGWKAHFVPAQLRNSSHPLAIVVIGILFALVFDTATQAAAWGYAATAHSGPAMALLVGLAFTAGMIITDTLDGRLMVRLLRQLSRRAEALAYRRKIGWIVVVLSYSIALYEIATHLLPAMTLGDTMVTVAGLALFLGLLAAYGWFVRSRPPPPRSFTRE